jgi:hypothetical protein
MKLKISRCTAAPANRIFLIDFLKDDDLQTGREKHEKVRDEILALMPEQAPFISKQVFLRSAKTLNELSELFKVIEQECNATTSPLIFFDGHGDKQRGLELPSGEFLSWTDFNAALETITIAAAGHSTVVASFCHSMAAVARPALEKPLPTPYYYGYADEVPAGVVEEEGARIIEELLKTGAFVESGKSIQHFSEYDHVEPLISVLLMKFLRSEQVVDKFTDLSKNNLRRILHDDIGRHFGTTKGLSKVLSRALDPRILIGPILEGAMHATERRTRLLAEVLQEIELHMAKNST